VNPDAPGSGTGAGDGTAADAGVENVDVGAVDDGGTEPPTPGAVRERLRSVVDPCSAAVGTDIDVVELGLIEAVTVEGNAVTVSMRLTSPGCLMVEYFAREVDEVVGALPGVERVTLEPDAGFEWHRGMMESSARAKRQRRRRKLRERYGDDVESDGHEPASLLGEDAGCETDSDDGPDARRDQVPVGAVGRSAARAGRERTGEGDDGD
jgi:metal-sulfur cluster biosynthetic enzyme